MTPISTLPTQWHANMATVTKSSKSNVSVLKPHQCLLSTETSKVTTAVLGNLVATAQPCNKPSQPCIMFTMHVCALNMSAFNMLKHTSAFFKGIICYLQFCHTAEQSILPCELSKVLCGQAILKF